MIPGLVTLAAIGCGGPTDDVGGTESALVGANGFAVNGFAVNGFAVNGFAVNGFAVNGFAVNGLAANGFAVNGFAVNGFAVNGVAGTAVPMSPSAAAIARDPASRELFKYIVSCALPEGQLLTLQDQGVTYTFGGALGVAPGWLSGPCDGSCQRWVTACVLSRVNHLGQHVEISMRGDNPALATAPHEEQLYTAREASYYGNFFEATPEVYTCLPPDATSISRVCGPSLSGCPMTVAGHCDDVCDGPGRHQTFRDCAATARTGAHDSRTTFPETITVFLRP